MASMDSEVYIIACVPPPPPTTTCPRFLADLEQHPHLSPEETWKSLFTPQPKNLAAEDAAALQKVKEKHSLFTPSLKPAHEVMLDLLRENEPDTITIVAVGPLTNLAIAAAKEPETFLKVKEVVVMGGAIDAPGNVSFVLFSSLPIFPSPNPNRAIHSSERLFIASTATPPPHLLPNYPLYSRSTIRFDQTAEYSSSVFAKQTQPDDPRSRVQHLR
jgi:hypothetical protein